MSVSLLALKQSIDKSIDKPIAPLLRHFELLFRLVYVLTHLIHLEALIESLNDFAIKRVDRLHGGFLEFIP